MAYRIEQDKQQVKDAFALQVNADIDDVRVISAAMNCKIKCGSLTHPVTYLIQHKAERIEVAPGRLSVAVAFGFKAITKEETPSEVVKINCRIGAEYTLEDGYEPSLAETEAFKDSNAVFNCWPYFREFIQSSLMRMGYPPLVVPFLRLVPKATADVTIEATPEQLQIPPAEVESSGESEYKRTAKKTNKRSKIAGIKR